MSTQERSENTAAPIVIVGTGLAGYTVARELRKLDGDVPIVMISRDDGRFYSKPMLSNALALKKEPGQLATSDATAMASQLRARIWTQCAVKQLLPDAHALVLDNGQTLRYRALVLAMGADAKRAPIDGDGAADVLSINDLHDYARFRETLRTCRSVAILGAGLIGCEFANDLIATGHRVDIIDPAELPLSRLLPQEAGNVFRSALEAAGVRLRLGTSVRSIARRERGYRLLLSNAVRFDVDVVLSAIGLAPRVLLAREAGLAVSDGIATDAWCRTSAPDIYALGDCASIDGRVRPYVLPIMHAARAVAQCLCGTLTRAEFPIMPIVIKTPAIPAVVVTPAADGLWTTEIDSGDARHVARARCEDPTTGRMTGFALLDAATKDKAAWLQAMASEAQP
ncbi:NAD(P)/FAD-dependent oxidoreductase [Trinickia acidisoli]|uniref:NAD(P)/FAD-dependent oxidoreductase n=1 Tax=Trinickia acidisoli TaxID=2767482 RepID=UPI001A8D4AA0|nr:FAD-dependent oxidoreductase [Trinickia acidisoli]